MQRQKQLTAAGDICTQARLRQKPQDGWIAIGLDSVANQRVGWGMAQIGMCLVQDGRQAVNVQRRAVAFGQIG